MSKEISLLNKEICVIIAKVVFDSDQSPESIFKAANEIEVLVNNLVKPCEHEFVSSVAYKGAKVCSKCGNYK